MRLRWQQFFRPVNVLSISNVSSFRFLPLRVGKLLFTNSSIIPRMQGVRFSLARFVSPLGYMKQVPKYAETKRVHGTGSEIHAVACGPKNCGWRMHVQVSSSNTQACMYLSHSKIKPWNRVLSCITQTKRLKYDMALKTLKWSPCSAQLGGGVIYSREKIWKGTQQTRAQC